MTLLSQFHFLRPYALFAFLILMIGSAAIHRLKKTSTLSHPLCDPHLLPYLLVQSSNSSHTKWSFRFLGFSLSFMILALAGPSYMQEETPIYQNQRPHVILLDGSSDMQQQDLLPNRLERAKFKLQDVLRLPDPPPIGLILYSSEPFVASPITDDAQTMEVLIQSITPDLLPIDGNEPDQALIKATALVHQSGYPSADLLLITGHPPTSLPSLPTLQRKGFTLSILPLLSPDSPDLVFFKTFSQAHQISLFNYSKTSNDIFSWLKQTQSLHKQTQHINALSVWRDEGRWCILIAILCLLPLFRQGAMELFE